MVNCYTFYSPKYVLILGKKIEDIDKKKLTITIILFDNEIKDD